MFPTDDKGNSFANVKTFVQKMDQCMLQIDNIEPSSVDGKGRVKRKGRGSDDSFFQKYPQYHKHFPRCFSITQVKKKNGKEWEVVKQVILRGFYKFTGLTEGDEDDSKPCGSLVPPNLTSLYTKVLRIEKLNGKCSGVRLFQVDDVWWIVGGSKGVHRCVRLEHFEEDLDALDKKTSPLIYQILRSFYREYMSTTPEKQQLIKKRLGEEEYSLCGELEDGQHMEPHEGEPTVRWFGLANSSERFSEETSLTGHILENLQEIEGWGFSVPQYQLMSKEEHLELSKTERFQRGKEGWVKHYLNDNHETVFVEKVKTVWYVLIRMLREAVKGSDNILSNAPGKIKSRLRDRNSFLKLPETMLVVWYRLMVKFVKWFVEKGYTKSVIGFTNEARGMGNVWQEFLMEHPDETDDFGNPHDYIKDLPKSNLNENFQERLLVCMQGIPGNGKTALAEWIRERQILCETLEQDTFKGDKRLCLQRLDELLASENRIIILARNNSKPFQYQQFLNAANEANWKVLFVTPSELMQKDSRQDKFVEICETSVKERTGHLTFDALKPQDRVKIVRSFRSQFTPAQISSHIHSTYRMDWLQQTDSGTYERRTLESMGSELLSVINQRIKLSPEPVYIGLPLSSPFRDGLQKCISQYFKMQPDSKVLLDHLTLQHSFNLTSNNSSWTRFKERMEALWKIQVIALHLKKESVEKGSQAVHLHTHAVFECRVYDENNVEVTDQIESGFAHITGIIPKSDAPKISNTLYRENKFTETITLETPLETDSNVTFYY